MAKKFKEMSFKEKVSNILCIVSFVFGSILTVAGMCIPPQGVIDGTVLTALGMFLAFTGSILGISNHYKLELEKIKAIIGNEDNKK